MLVPTRGVWINAAGVSAAAATGAVGWLLGACHATRSLQVMPLGAQHAHAARAACTPRRHLQHEVLIDGKGNHDGAPSNQPVNHVGSCGIKPNIARRGLRSRGRAKQSVHHRHLQGAGVNEPTAAAPTVPANRGWHYPYLPPLAITASASPAITASAGVGHQGPAQLRQTVGRTFTVRDPLGTAPTPLAHTGQAWLSVAV